MSATTSRVVAVYADGGVIGPNPSPLGGTWAWCWVDTDQRVVPDVEPHLIRRDSGSVHLKSKDATSNNHSEYLALLRALRDLPEGWSGRVYSDSAITLGRFFQGWRHENVPDGWEAAMREVVGRLGAVEWILLDGHPTRAQLAAGVGKRGNPVSSFNRWCDLECGRIAAHRKASLDSDRLAGVAA